MFLRNGSTKHDKKRMLPFEFHGAKYPVISHGRDHPAPCRELVSESLFTTTIYHLPLPGVLHVLEEAEVDGVGLPTFPAVLAGFPEAVAQLTQRRAAAHVSCTDPRRPWMHRDWTRFPAIPDMWSQEKISRSLGNLYH